MTYMTAKQEAQRIADAMGMVIHVIHNSYHLYHDTLGDGVQAKAIRDAGASSDWRIVATCHPTGPSG